MGEVRSKTEKDKPTRRRRPLWIFQVESDDSGTVIRVLDTLNDTVFREIPVEEFLDYAREHKNVTPFLLGKLPGAVIDPN